MVGLACLMRVPASCFVAAGANTTTMFPPEVITCGATCGVAASTAMAATVVTATPASERGG
jgi:hypothetical protein